MPDIDELHVGQSAEMAKTVTEADIAMFASVTGDFNPVHVDAVAAQQSIFGERIAHGILSAGFISAVIGMQLPGPGCIYLSQTLRFTKPVRIGDTITARVEVMEILAAKRRVRLGTACRNQNEELVVDGEAVVMIGKTTKGERA
jgi:3-hydroxybutyryl-CoA dehydratase